MYKTNKITTSNLKINTATIGERIEEKVGRIQNNGEPIKDGAPLVYTERKEGVQAGYNIKTDPWEVAADLTDKIAKNKRLSREQALEELKESKKPAEKPAEKPDQGTGEESKA